jgi:hypothetical protein
MKCFPYAMIAFVATIASTSAYAVDDMDTLFKFEGGIGSQPLRAGSAVNTVAGINPGGAPWVIESLKAEIKTNGEISAKVKGVLLGGTDNIGTRGGQRKMVASLFCRSSTELVPPAVSRALDTIPYNSQFVDLDANGEFHISGSLTNASGATPPADCGDKIDNRPVLLLRTVTAGVPGAWFAAGILKD